MGRRSASRALRGALALDGLAAAFVGSDAASAAVRVTPVCGAVPIRHFRCFSLSVNGSRRPFDGRAPSGYGPPELQAAYNAPSATAGAGQIVAIVDAFDDPTAESDLAAVPLVLRTAGVHQLERLLSAR